MSIRFLRASIIFLLLGAGSQITGQTGPAIDSAVYLAFFREAAGVFFVARANGLEDRFEGEVKKIIDLAKRIRMSAPHESATD